MKSKKKGGRGVFNGMKEAGTFKEQPEALGRKDLKCPICGVPVDRKRLEAHKVRFHGRR